MKTFIFVLLALVAYTSAHVCKAEGDPHYRTFGGAAFDFYATGEYLLFERAGMKCTTQLRTNDAYWVGKSLNAGVSCNANGVHFEIATAGETVKAYLNKQANFNGAKTINGVVTSRTGNTFSFKYKDMELKGNYNHLPQGPLRYYFNLYVYSQGNGATGLCHGQKTKVLKTAFHHGNPPQFREGAKRKLDPNWVAFAEKNCKPHFQVGSFDYKVCVADMADSKKKMVAGQIAKFSELVKGNFKRVCHKTHCHYYKRHTKVHIKKWTTKHQQKVTVVDHQKQQHATAQIHNHEHARNQLIRRKELDIITARCDANKKINSIKLAIDHVENHYKKTVHHWNNWHHSITSEAKKAFEQSQTSLTKWRRTIKDQAIAHEKKVVAQWKTWKENQIKHAENQLKSVRKWKADRFVYAEKHFRTEVEKKRTWMTGRFKYAETTKAHQIKHITNWRAQQLKALNQQIENIRKQTSLKVDKLNHTHTVQINKHTAEIKKWTATHKSATKQVTKTVVKHHQKKEVKHVWKHVAHHAF